MRKRILYSILLGLFLTLPLRQSSQIPIGSVVDVPLAASNTITLIAEQLHRLLLEDEEGFASIIGDVQAFFQKAQTKVNATILNMRLIRSIVNIHAEIIDLHLQSIQQLNQARDNDFDGQDDLYFLDKWKHIQILLAISDEATRSFELFAQLVEDDKLTIDDKGRVLLIQKIYQNLLRTRSAMYAHIRRINKHIYNYSRTKREILAFEKLF